MSNQPSPDSGPSKARQQEQSRTAAGPRFRKNAGGNSNNRNNTGNSTGRISAHESPAPQHQNVHQPHVHHLRTQSPRVSPASVPPPRMAQAVSGNALPHSPAITYAHPPNLVHPHAHANALRTYSPQPSHSPLPNHSPRPARPSHSPTFARPSHSSAAAHSHTQPFHIHGHSSSLHASPNFPQVRMPTFIQMQSSPHHVYSSPSPRSRPMSMHAGLGLGSMPGTPPIGYGISGEASVATNVNLGVGTGMVAYNISPIRTNDSEIANSSVNSGTSNNTTGAGSHYDQSTAFNLCRRRVVIPPGIEGRPSTLAALADPELVGVAVRLVNPHPLLLPNGFLWEFEIPRGMVPAPLTNGVLNVTQTASPLLLESRPADTCARGEHTARIYMPQQCLETYPDWEEKRAEWIGERAEQYSWHGRIPDVSGSHISLSNRTGKHAALWVCKSRLPDLSQRSEREVLVITRAALQNEGEDWSGMVCRRAMPPVRTHLPNGESRLKTWILRALSILVLQGVEVVEWSYEFLISEQQFWWVYRGQSQSGGDPDLFELDRGEPIFEST